FVAGEALCLMSDATMAILDEHITQGKLGEAEALVAEFAREGCTLAEKNTLELGFSEDAAKAAGLFVANVAKNLQHARPSGKVAPKKIAEPEPKFSKLTGPIKASQHASPRNVSLEALDLEPPKIHPFSSNYWKKSDVHTFRSQTNRVHKRDDLIDLRRVDSKGRSSEELMKRGLAPIGPDKKPINLHHLIQTKDGALAEISGTMHSQYHKTLHIWSNQSKGGVTRAEILPKIDRAAFDAWKADYWKARVAELEKLK
ncbi:MAG: HNH/ENDO VII family nuclease, partial [Alphaproteobacteria bacterium]